MVEGIRFGVKARLAQITLDRLARSLTAQLNFFGMWLCATGNGLYAAPVAQASSSAASFWMRLAFAATALRENPVKSAMSWNAASISCWGRVIAA